MPLDIVGKSVKEIKEMGFVQVLNVDIQRNPRTQGLEPAMSAEDREAMRKA